LQKSLTCCSCSYKRLTDIQRGRAGYIPKLRAGNRAGKQLGEAAERYDPTDDDGSRWTEVNARRRVNAARRGEENRTRTNANVRGRSSSSWSWESNRPPPLGRLFGETEADIGWWYQPRSSHGPSSSSTYSPPRSLSTLALK